MYNVKLDNCGGTAGKTQVDILIRDVSEIQLPFIINKANEAFCSMEATDNETGEIIYTSYVADRFYNPMSTEGEVLDEIYRIMEDMK